MHDSDLEVMEKLCMLLFIVGSLIVMIINLTN